MFLNGNSYNYLAYGLGKIIPENRSAQFAYINLAQRYLSQYRVEYGNIQSGYDNFPIARLDYPVNGIFHSPLTYYYGGNIVPTKNIPVYINNGYCALENALVYNDINTSGNIVHFATNTDFQGHNVNIHPENIRSSQPYFDGTVMDNCSNFLLHSGSRLSKSSQATLYGCNKFIGWFNFFGDDDGTRFPGFRGFLHTCRDGVFSFNLMNMHGGGSDGSVTNYYNFSCISNCNNIKLNINGSPWQAWVHPNCYSGNCNINTRYIVPGFDRINHCNLNLYIPRDANKVEKSAFYSILSNSYNCNVYFDGTNSNLFGFRNNYNLFLFEDLNNCNLNLLLNNSADMGFSFGNRLNNCNIVFNNVNFAPYYYRYFSFINNCKITGSIIEAENSAIDLITYSTNVNLNVNASLTNNFSLIYGSSYINGNAILGNAAYVRYSNNLILYLYNGNYLDVNNVSDSKFTLNNVKNVNINGAYNSNFNLHNATGTAVLNNLNNVKFVERGGANYTITYIDNCRNSWIYANTFVTGWLDNVYNTRLELVNNNAEFKTWRVDKCEIDGFPYITAYTSNCTFNTSISQMAFRWNSNNGYVTWNNIWPHATPRGSVGWDTWYRTKAGLRSVDNFSRCCLIGNNGSLVSYESSINFDKVNNMQCDIKTFYPGTVTANLPNYNMNIKLNVDCSILNLGVFQSGPPHGFQNATISADTIYAKGNGAGGGISVYLNCDTKIYCENYCNTPFTISGVQAESSVLQPVLLINNYQHSNTEACYFRGGLTRIGRLNYQGAGSPPATLYLNKGAFVFINNALLGNTNVSQNAVLFVGSNVTFTKGYVVDNGGLVVNKENWGYWASEIQSRIYRNVYAWNVWDSGPWGSRSLFDYCTNV